MIRMRWQKLFPRHAAGPGGIALACLAAVLFIGGFGSTDSRRLIASASLFSFRHPLSYYNRLEERRKTSVDDHTLPGYLPSTSFVLAAWSLPLRIAGVPPDSYLAYHYWFKLGYLAVLLLSAMIFHRILFRYGVGRRWARFGAAGWLTMPFAYFSPLIYGQCDIFYLFFMLCGFYLFITRRLPQASLLFGIAVTFKYQPVFLYVPLLLLHEKRLGRLLGNAVIFAAPAAAVIGVYRLAGAPLGRLGEPYHITKLFESAVYFAGPKYYHAYALLLSFVLLSGWAWMRETTDEGKRIRFAAFLLLAAPASSIVFGVFNAYMPIFMAPGLVLTTMLETRWRKFLALDLIGWLCAVGFMLMFWYHDFPESIFLGNPWGMELDYVAGPMGELFRLPVDFLVGRTAGYGTHTSYNIYYTCFLGYVLLNCLMKYRALCGTPDAWAGGASREPDYGAIRLRIIVGAFFFLVPVLYSVHKSVVLSSASAALEMGLQRNYGKLASGREMAQSFVAVGDTLLQTELFLATYKRKNACAVRAEIVGDDGEVLASSDIDGARILDNAWLRVRFGKVPVVRGETYRLRLSSPDATDDDAVTWWANTDDPYPGGKAIVDGADVPDADFVFKVIFKK